jgi:hypothetical protein
MMEILTKDEMDSTWMFQYTRNPDCVNDIDYSDLNKAIIEFAGLDDDYYTEQERLETIESLINHGVDYAVNVDEVALYLFGAKLLENGLYDWLDIYDVLDYFEDILTTPRDWAVLAIDRFAEDLDYYCKEYGINPLEYINNIMKG